MIPPFGIEGGVWLATGRAVSVVGLFLAFGSLLGIAVVVPPGLQAATTRKLQRLAWWALGFGASGAAVWLLLQTVDMAGSASLGNLGAVLGHTQFGHLLATRLVLLGLAAVAFASSRNRPAAALAGVALALQAGHSHAMAMDGPGLMLVVAVLHLLAGGAWLGGLPALLVMVRRCPDPLAQQAIRRFSRLGIGCVLMLLATSLAQFSGWIGDVPGLVGTAYGWMAMVKLTLFAALIAIALRNRRRLTPALPASRVDLCRSIVLEMALGLAVVAAAGVLTELPPSMHVQKLWPFSWIPSLGVLREDPDYRLEAICALAALALAAILLLAASLWRRRPALRAVCGAGALAVAGLAIPHLSPLLVPAEPTLFFHSTAGFTSASIASGADLFAKRCTACHGGAGHGDGPAAPHLPLPPADLTAAHLWMHRDGELYWWISHGIEGPDGSLAMPGAPDLAPDDIWSLIDYLHAHNAGLTVQGGHWGTRLHAPDFPITCEPSSPTMLSGLRGKLVRLVIGAPAGPAAGATTILATPRAKPSHGICVAERGAVARAYALATGAAPIVDGTEVLIDANGWLRETGPAGRWTTPGLLEDAIAGLAALPAAGAASAMAMPGMKM